MNDVFPIKSVQDALPADTANAQPLSKRPDFDVGSTRVRPSRLALEGPSGSVLIERRVMEVLMAFVDANGAVLNRDDLMARCWPGVIVGDDAVRRVIGGLRRAAATVGGDFTIETIPRIGYRLQRQDEAAQRDCAALGIAAPVEPAMDVPLLPSRTLSRRGLLAGGGAALVVGGGTAFWMSRSPAHAEAERLQAEADMLIRSGEPSAIRHAIAVLERAVTIAPEDATPWGALALARARVDEHGAPDATVLPVTQIEQPARRALALDPINGDAKAALAIAIPYYGDWLAAERRFDAVLAQHPSHIATHMSRGFLLNGVGRLRDGSTAMLAATNDALFDADVQYRRIYAHWFLGRTTEADQVASRAMQMWPRNSGIWLGRLWLLAGTGRFDRALVQISDKPALPPLPPPMFETLRLAMTGLRDQQPAMIEAAATRVMASVGSSVTAVVIGMMLLNLCGKTDLAFDLARAYYLEDGPIITAMQWRPGQPIVQDQRRRKTNMLFTPIAASMQRDPRFLPLMNKMGLSDYWRRRGVQPDFLV